MKIKISKMQNQFLFKKAFTYLLLASIFISCNSDNTKDKTPEISKVETKDSTWYLSQPLVIYAGALWTVPAKVRASSSHPRFTVTNVQSSTHTRNAELPAQTTLNT